MLHTCDRITEKGIRLYASKRDGKRYPSITTILWATKDMEGLNQWRQDVGEAVANYIMRTAARIGTETHELIEKHLQGIQVDISSKPLLAQAHFNNLKPHLAKVTDVRGLEVMLHSDDLEIAGTADCIARYDGLLSIIDWKTKRSDQRLEWITDHFIQATAYAFMWQEHAFEQIKQIVVIVSSESGKNQVFIEKPENFKQQLLDRIKIYNEQR